MARKISVELVGDASDLSRAFKDAESSARGLGGRLGGAFSTLAKGAAVAGAAITGGFAVVIKQGFDELAESQAVAAQTAAVLKSTGGAANVTAKEISALASAISAKTGIDDEAIQSGQNLLLTFTNIRNEVGAGNDIFDQSTRILADMSQALGQDMKSSAIQLGKALNDPLKGLSALSRVGVSFTAEQKAMVKSMMATGDQMGAQKLILAELNKEFGGSAEAFGKTLPGSLAKTKNAFAEASAELASALAPAVASVMSAVAKAMPHIVRLGRAFIEQVRPHVQAAVAFVRDNWPAISGVLQQVASAAKTALQALAAAIKTVVSAGRGVVDFFRGGSAAADALLPVVAAAGAAMLAFAVALKVAAAASKAFAAAQLLVNLSMRANPLVLAATAVVALGVALVVAYKRSERFREIVNGAFASIKSAVLPVVEAVRSAWTRFGDDIQRVGTVAFAAVVAVVRNFADVIRGLINVLAGLITGDWSRVWDGLKTAVDGVFGNMIGLAKKLGPELLDALVGGLNALGKEIRKALGAVIDALADVARDALAAAEKLGRDILDKIVGGITGIGSQIGGKLGEIATELGRVAGTVGSTATSIGTAIKNAIVDGVTGVGRDVANLVTGIPGALAGIAGTIGAKLGAIGGAIKNAIVGGVTGLAGDVKDMVDNIPGALAGLAEGFASKAAALGGRIKTGVVSGVTGIVTGVIDLVNNIPPALVGLAEGFAAKAAALGGAVKRGVVSGVTGIVTGVIDLVNNIPGALAGLTSGFAAKAVALGATIKNSIVDGLKGLGDAVVGAIRGAVNAAIGAVNAVIGRINSALEFKVSIPFAPDVSINPPDIPTIPGLARGGIVSRPTLAMVGEAGPEAVVPLSQLRASASGGGNTYHITVSGAVGSPAQIADVIRRELLRTQARNGSLGFT